jgi:DNA-binding transcriptional ArsR family regulator
MKSAALKNLPTEKIDIAESMLRAIKHPLRMKIISFIDKSREVNVNKIYKALKIEQSVASQQLRILRDDAIVLAHKKGKFVFYSVNYRTLEKIMKSIGKFFNS